MRVESDEHIFKFLKSKFGYGLGRYVCNVYNISGSVVALFTNSRRNREFFI